MNNQFEIKEDFYLNGEKIQIISGAIHYFRIVPEYWRDRLEKLKAMGCNTVETYIPWNLHEKEKSLFEVKKEEVEASCKTKIKETEKRCKELLEMTKELCDERKKETEEKCQCMEQKAKEEVEKKWNDLSGRLEEFYESHQGLRELLSSGKMI